MATNLDVITDALRAANIINEREVPSATQGSRGLTLLNNMMSDWHDGGLELGYYPQTSQSATIPVDDKYLRGITANLARAVAADYNIPLNAEAVRIAELTYERLAKSTAEEVNTDFNHMPLGRGQSRYDIDTDQ